MSDTHRTAEANERDKLASRSGLSFGMLMSNYGRQRGSNGTEHAIARVGVNFLYSECATGLKHPLKLPFALAQCAPLLGWRLACALTGTLGYIAHDISIRGYVYIRTITRDLFHAKYFLLLAKLRRPFRFCAFANVYFTRERERERGHVPLL